MAFPIVECVPNFSEGRDRAVIDKITASMAAVDGAQVLDVDPGAATHRTVVTVVGPPEAVLEAAYRGIATASELIDMTRHRGEHPRMGATDVCPFVPIRDISMEECAALARRLGERVGRELGIPVFLYEAAAASPARKNLADIRAGEYEGLETKLKDPAWKPDFGPTTINRRSGATVIGARKFLIAYNVNLNTRAKKLATEIALEVREQGRQLKNAEGQVQKDAQGKPVMKPGRLKTVKAVGWYIEEYQRAQVSVNITDFDVANLDDVFEVCDEEARKLGVRVTGSELVGLVPLEALLRVGRRYLERQGRCQGIPEAQIVETAVQSLGLSELQPFDPMKRVIEYRLALGTHRLVDKSIASFVDELSSESPAPGGGSVAALSASLASGLCAMVANLTHGKKGHEAATAKVDEVARRAQVLKDRFLRAIDDDTNAFHRLMAANRLPKNSSAEAQTRAKALDAASREAISVPLAVLQDLPEVVALASQILAIGNPNAASDAATAAATALAGAEGAFFNVLTNLKGYEGDSAWALETRAIATQIVTAIRVQAKTVIDAFVARM